LWKKRKVFGIKKEQEIASYYRKGGGGKEDPYRGEEKRRETPTLQGEKNQSFATKIGARCGGKGGFLPDRGEEYVKKPFTCIGRGGSLAHAFGEGPGATEKTSKRPRKGRLELLKEVTNKRKTQEGAEMRGEGISNAKVTQRGKREHEVSVRGEQRKSELRPPGGP